MMIAIELNGSAHQIADGQTVGNLVSSMQLNGKAVAVAVNRDVVPGSQWQYRQLHAGERVDIVWPIGGG